MIISFFVVFDWEATLSVKESGIRSSKTILDEFILTSLMVIYVNVIISVIPLIKHESGWVHPYFSSPNQTWGGINSSLTSGMTPSHPSLTLNQTHPKWIFCVIYSMNSIVFLNHPFSSYSKFILYINYHIYFTIFSITNFSLISISTIIYSSIIFYFHYPIII
jgi:hypothetical protein